MLWSQKPPLRINGAEFNVPPVLGLNHSFFVPCLKFKETYTRVLDYYAINGYKLVWAERVEEGVLGIRVWRTA